jgi:rubrerythrin
MDVLEYAMNMELDGESYYREQAGQVKNPGAVKFFTLLADEERLHYDLFSQLREGKTPLLKPTFGSGARSFFENLKAEGGEFQKADAKILDVLGHGLEIENKSIKFYVSEMQKTEDAALRELLLFLKREEDKHYSFLSALIDYYMKPQLWLEQAEFSHWEEY